MITLKIKYTTNKENVKFIQDLQRQYSISLKVIYKYLKLGFSQKQVKERLKSYNNIDFIINNSWFVASLFYDVKPLLSKDNVCFKAKYLTKRDKDKITNEQWKQVKNLPLCSVGDALKHSNRFFRFVDKYTLMFCPNKKIKIELSLKDIGKNRLKIIEKLIEVQQNSLAPICYKLDSEYVYISFDEKLIENKEQKVIRNRIFAIDLNPNFIGYSIIDWKDTEQLKFRIVKTGVVDFKNINDKHFEFNKQRNIPSTDKRRIHLNNKRDREVFEACKFLINQAKHYKCEIFSMEDLTIKSSDKKKGKQFNSLCNNIWYRSKLTNNLIKRCNQQNIKIQKVQPQHSSILGNLLYRKLNLPDMILSSIEISRRCQEFNLQYLKQEKEKKKNIIYPELNSKIKSLLHQSMEELGVNDKSYNLEDCNWLINLENFSSKIHQPWFKI